MKQSLYKQYVDILEEELIPALGCTEPACLAIAGAKVREVLGGIPEHVVVKMNGGFFKNAKSVCIPKSGGLKGIVPSVVLGIVGGVSALGLEVLSQVSAEDLEDVHRIITNQDYCDIQIIRTTANLHVVVEGSLGTRRASVEILHRHTNIVRVMLDDDIILDTGETPECVRNVQTDRGILNVSQILQFATECNLYDVAPLLRRQVDYNQRISEEGLAGDYGARIGRSTLQFYGTDIKNRARAAAAAASDARMGGSQLPVVVNSGSGNQGITVSLPIIVYAEHYGISEDKMLRALIVSNLVAIHLKAKVGRLSAYCGAVSAACGSGAGITYMMGGSFDQVSSTINNTLGNISGIICDGAKPSCAAKIASAVDAALVGHSLAMGNVSFQAGDGIVKSDIEQTIDAISSIAVDGMEITDEVVLRVITAS